MGFFYHEYYGPDVIGDGVEQRTVITEFDSADPACAAFTNDAYQAAFALLGDVERGAQVIEGLDCAPTHLKTHCC